MKKLIVLIAILVFVNSSYAQNKKELLNQVSSLKRQVAEMEANLKKNKEINFENKVHKFSYALGVVIGDNLKRGGFKEEEISYFSFKKAIEDVVKGNEKMSLLEASEYGRSVFMERKKMGAEEKSKEGRLFLEENKKNKKVKTTVSGLQYEIMVKGSGKIPLLTNKVTVHYTGKLINGKVFDSSVERGKPADFFVNEVVQGWKEALQLMPVGSKWKLYIPHNLAYGERGAGKDVPPYSVLIFEVELLDIVE